MRISQKIKPYLRDIIIDLQESARWKKQLTVALNFISSRDTEEQCVMHSKRGRVKFTPFDNASEIVVELFR